MISSGIKLYSNVHDFCSIPPKLSELNDMNLYKNKIYIMLKKLYFNVIQMLLENIGVGIIVSGYKLKFYPRHYRWFPSDYECSSFEFLKQNLKKGSVCIDVGAHFGLYTLVMSRYFNCRVYCFEPTPYSADVLEKNIILNNVKEQVDIYRKAVSSNNGVANFVVQETEGSVANSLISYWHSDELNSKISVQVVTIDSIFENKYYDFIKIDAEGAELDVLRGATISIRKFKPLIMLGLHPSAMVANNHSLKMVWEWILVEGYVCYYEGRQLSESFFCMQNVVFDVFLVRKAMIKEGEYTIRDANRTV